MALEAPQSATTTAPSAGPARARRALLAMLVLLVLSVICSPFFVDRVDHDAPAAARGVLDVSAYGPLTAPIELKGVWRVDWLTPPVAGASFWLPVPRMWAGAKVNGHVLPQSGAASYHLTLRGVQPGRYMLFMPKTYG